MSIENIWQFDLRRGASDDPRNGACLLDAVSWFEYGHLGDHPACVCPVFAAYGRSTNDTMSDAGRQRLKALIPKLIGTVDLASERARGEYFAWAAIRVFLPLALDAAGRHGEAEHFRNFSGSLKEAAAVAWVAVAWAAEAALWAAAREAAAEAAEAAAVARESAAEAAEAAAEAAEAAAEAAAAAVLAAWAEAAWAAVAKVEDAMIEVFEGALAIGRQAEPIEAERIEAVNRSFAEARAL